MSDLITCPNCGHKFAPPPSRSAPAGDIPVADIKAAWDRHFPEKPQPRLRPGSAAMTALIRRWRDPEFRNLWREAMLRASQSSTCQLMSWFDFDFFVGRKRGQVENWRKCYDRKYAWRDKELYEELCKREVERAERRKAESYKRTLAGYRDQVKHAHQAGDRDTMLRIMDKAHDQLGAKAWRALKDFISTLEESP